MIWFKRRISRQKHKVKHEKYSELACNLSLVSPGLYEWEIAQQSNYYEVADCEDDVLGDDEVLQS